MAQTGSGSEESPRGLGIQSLNEVVDRGTVAARIAPRRFSVCEVLEHLGEGRRGCLRDVPDGWEAPAVNHRTSSAKDVIPHWFTADPNRRS